MLQREGQGGLEVCPGREASTDFGVGNDWTPVVPRNDAITINIGDLLMRWCDVYCARPKNSVSPCKVLCRRCKSMASMSSDGRGGPA